MVGLAEVNAGLQAIGTGLDIANALGGSHHAEQTAERFAQHGIRWRVMDAQKAGIHPLYALGAPTFQPPAQTVLPSMAEAFGQIGQNFQGAIDRTRSAEERAAARTQALTVSAEQAKANQLELEHMSLQNELLKSQIARVNSVQAAPIPATGNTGMSSVLTGGTQSDPMVSINPVQRTSSEPGVPGKEAGIVPDYTYSKGYDGNLYIVPSTDVNQRAQDWAIPELLWAWRNQIVPMFSPPPKPDTRLYPLPPGQDWSWKWWKWVPSNSGRSHVYTGEIQR